jgi:hypothetical protein
MNNPDAAHGYLGQVSCHAARERLVEAVSTLGGLRGWWTPIVTGAAGAGGTLTFGFEGLDETIVMYVEEVTPDRVRWSCRQHTSAPRWTGTTITFEFRADGPRQSLLAFQHLGLHREDVAAGWDHFLASLSRWADTGTGDPYRADESEALRVARAYHAAWTGKDFATARRCLAPDLRTDVPLNTYTDRDDFAAAMARFGALAERVDMLAEFSTATQALQLYDLHTQPFGTLRIAEHLTVHDGLIRHIRHVHDTATLRGTP